MYGDPAAAKADAYRVSSNSSPMHADGRHASPTYVAVGTVAAPPVFVQTTAPGSTAEAMGVHRAMLRQPPPVGHWADGICDWASNLYPSCYCACCVCYGIYIVAQSKCTWPSPFINTQVSD
ncbi:hypothetical protein EON65_21990 [archaeon]|nr:MAG: hypothetical protein EON65_21990 [archaeon]